MECESAVREEAALVQQMARGDERAIARLYDVYSPRLFGLALALVGERADAEEVVLDTFTQAWRSASTFDVVRGSVRTWLTTIARSRSLDCIRSRSRRQMAYERAGAEAAIALVESGAMTRSGALASDRLDHQELQTRIAFALQQLPIEQRQVIELSFLGGSSHARVAEQLGLPLGTVKTRARSALRKMRTALVAENAR